MFDPRGVHGLKEEYDLIIVGAGLSGAVVAEQVKQLPPIAREEKVIAGQFSSGSLLPGDREEGAHWGELLRLHRRARHRSQYTTMSPILWKPSIAARTT